MINISGGGTPKTSERAYWGSEIPFFTPKDAGNFFTLKTEKQLSQLGLDSCNSALFAPYTVFITARGTVGKISLAGKNMAMNQSCYALTGKNGLHQILVYFYTKKILSSLKAKATGSVFDAIVTRDFETEKVRKLSDKDTSYFLDIAVPVVEKILLNSIEGEKLSALRDSLLNRFFSIR
jgi:type I restriction enzyme S subunit